MDVNILKFAFKLHMPDIAQLGLSLNPTSKKRKKKKKEKYIIGDQIKEKSIAT